MPLLYVTDLAYPARGRRYCDEDIFLTSRLRARFDLALCHPEDAEALLPLGFDAVIVRNSGPVLHYQQAYDSFRAAALAMRHPGLQPADRPRRHGGQAVPPRPDGHRLPGDPDDRRPGAAAGAAAGAPVRGQAQAGRRLHRPHLHRRPDRPGGEILIQPRIDFAYEVSFYFVDDAFQYALYAPDPARRWELVPYAPTDADLAFARAFVAWNTLSHGIQRVDACRAPSGELLLVELEDLNPYLSLDLVPADVQDRFITSLTESLHSFLT